MCGRTLNEILPEKTADGEYRNRKVLTNLPFLLDECELYMRKHHPEWLEQADLAEQLIVWPLEEEAEFCLKFWRYRGTSRRPKVRPPHHQWTREDLAALGPDDWEDVFFTDPLHDDISKAQYEKEGIRPNWLLNHEGGGVVYILDELHKFLSSRNWKDTPPVILDYNSQHRHFGDTIFWASQVPGMVDKNFRNITQDFNLLRNLENERFGKFKRGAGFKIYCFQDESMRKGTEDYTETFALDKDGVAKCYKTSIIGGDADTKAKRKGINVKWLYAGVPALLVLFVLSSFVLTKSMSSGAKKALGIESATPLQDATPVALNGSFRPGDQSGLLDLEERERQLVQAASARKTLGGPAADRDEVSSLVRLKRVVPSDLVSMLRSGAAPSGESSAGVQIQALDSANAILLRGSESEVASLSLVIAQLDKEAEIFPIGLRCVIAAIDIEDGEGSSLTFINRIMADYMSVPFRVDSATLTGAVLGPGLGFEMQAGLLDTLVTALRTSGRFSVVSRPYIAGVNGREFSLSAGREIPIQTLSQDGVTNTTTTTFRDVLLTLSGRATKQPDGRYRLSIVQDNSDVIAGSAADEVPSLSRQSFTSEMLVRPGEVLVLGGLIVDTFRDYSEGAPIIAAIPGLRRLGEVERNNQRRELVVLLMVDDGSLSPPPSAFVPAIDPPHPTYSLRRPTQSAAARPPGLPQDKKKPARRKKRTGLFDRFKRR